MNFKEHEIKGYLTVDGKKVVYLKEGVKRKRFNDNLEPDQLEPHLNQELINYQKGEYFHKIVMGEDDFENN